MAELATIVIGVGVATLAVAATVLTLGSAAPLAACTISYIAMSYGVSVTVASAIEQQ